ncbi:G patch domain-containing protein 11 [Bienertia sinuspersici]
MAELRTTHNKQASDEEEDGDEDYMGDLTKFIPTEPSEPISKPKKLPPKTLTSSSNGQPSKKKPKFHNWQEEYKLKKEKKQLEEDEQTLKNTQSAIPQSNIGFKLLKQMGYTPGKGIGKEGREEPIGIEIRRGRAGIGREDPAKERLRREKERARRERNRFEWKKKEEEEMMEDFGFRKKLQWKSKRVKINFDKAKAVIDQLENREPSVEVEKEEEDDEEEEEEEVITEEG